MTFAFLQARRLKQTDLVGRGKSTASDAAPRNFLRVTWRNIDLITEKFGNLRGDLPGLRLHHEPARQPGQVGQVRGKMDITFPQALRQISESDQPTVNSDLNRRR